MSKPYKYVIKSSHNSSREEPSEKPRNSRRLRYEDDIYEEDLKNKKAKNKKSSKEDINSNMFSQFPFLEAIINLIKKTNPIGGGFSGLIKEFLSKSGNESSSNLGNIGSLLFSFLNSQQNGTETKNPLASLSMLSSLFNNSASAANNQGSSSKVNEGIDSKTLQDALKGFRNVLSSLNNNKG